MSTFHGCSRLGAAILTVVGIGCAYAGAWILTGLMAVLVVLMLSPMLIAWRVRRHEHVDDADYGGFE